MKKIFRIILVSIFSLITLNYIWNNLSFGNGVGTVIKVAVILAIFELILKPIIKILLLPINLLTLGLIRFAINTLGFYLAAFLIADFELHNIDVASFTWSGFVIPHLQFSGFSAYFISSLTFGIILYFFSLILFKKD